MIVEVKNGQDILKSGAKHICFAVNIEGINDSGFAGLISRNHWPKLADIGECELGTSITQEDNGVFYHALVCHSLRGGWRNSAEVVKRCFDSIPTDDEVATISIGTGLIGVLSGANFSEIRRGMEASSKRIVLF
ncbi:MAG: hypothetical protein K6F57_01915 [Candidatus Saccharibacteria bacterium]|nr:hypothetical protein [Candidatus Saccharibacteria bacterium]